MGSRHRQKWRRQRTRRLGKRFASRRSLEWKRAFRSEDLPIPGERNCMTDSSGDGRALVDTNIVVYAYDPEDPVKHQAAKSLLNGLSSAGHLVYTTQVFNEFCSVM